jgi:hypothetical protein
VLTVHNQALAGYDASTFNSIQGFKTFQNHFKQHHEKKISASILGGINTGMYCHYKHVSLEVPLRGPLTSAPFNLKLIGFF